MDILLFDLIKNVEPERAEENRPPNKKSCPKVVTLSAKRFVKALPGSSMKPHPESKCSKDKAKADKLASFHVSSLANRPYW
jgi:hypothetical protein